MKPFAVLLCTLLLVTSLTACGWVTITDGPAPSASNSAASDNDVTEEEPQPSSDVVVTAEDVQSAVEALVPDEYRGQSYSCDILTASDGSGFIVSLQIDVDTEDAAEIISGMEADISLLMWVVIASARYWWIFGSVVSMNCSAIPVSRSMTGTLGP